MNDHGEPVGFAWPGDEQVDRLFHLDHRRLDDEMLSGAEEERRRQAGAGSMPRAWAYESDLHRQETLLKRGYAPTDEVLCLRRRLLDGPVGEPRTPAGYALQHVEGEADLERRVAVHRAAFAPSRMRAAKHRAVMASQPYRPDLDLVVVAPDGSLAAFCIVWRDEANRLGVFEPVGTHPEHRRRVLGMAVPREGTRRLQALGARTAFVTSSGRAEPANALYDAARLPVIDRNRAWQRTL